LDGWTSPRGDSLYNFIITTPNCHEYLYALANYLGEHQTGNFIANKISDIIKKIEIIHNNYSQILNIRCIAHALNLLIANLVKTILIKEILKQANILIAFFQKSYLASRLLRDTISLMNIKSELLETYSKTYWVSIYDTTNSIVRVRPAIDKILEEKLDIFTNQEPIKRVINLLESRMAKDFAANDITMALQDLVFGADNN
ncbi:6572_t:CDS:2, partial [Gigaspora margarita]